MTDLSQHARLHASLQGKTLFITGASRGIGLAIGRRVGANIGIVIVAKTTDLNPKLPGTIDALHPRFLCRLIASRRRISQP